jgi:uncharacterized membrane protein
MDGHAAHPRATRARGARVGFYIHLAAYLGVNALLLGINLATTPGRLWVRWPLMGWGVGLLAHALVTFALPRSRGAQGGATLNAREADRDRGGMAGL